MLQQIYRRYLPSVTMNRNHKIYLTALWITSIGRKLTTIQEVSLQPSTAAVTQILIFHGIYLFNSEFFLHIGEQWDWPNVWAPFQHMLIVGLDNLNDDRTKKLAMKWAQRWVQGNHIAFKETNAMYEKVSVTRLWNLCKLFQLSYLTFHTIVSCHEAWWLWRWRRIWSAERFWLDEWSGFWSSWTLWRRDDEFRFEHF